MARPRSSDPTPAQLYETVANLATLAERERCAKIAESWRSPYGGPRDLEVAEAIAAAIRAVVP